MRTRVIVTSGGSMKSRRQSKSKPLSRRQFLTMAAVGTVAIAIDPMQSRSETATVSFRDKLEGASPDNGGIAPDAFENARRRATELVNQMTIEEKISQFGATAPSVPRLKIPGFKYYGSEALHGLIHDGPITSFPLPLALGCTWNRSLTEQAFNAVSDEIWAWHKKEGQSLAMFSPPTVNMGTRDPRWGRIGENYGEDPVLVAELAVATVHGMQGHDPHYLKTIACAKHFIANDTEDDREVTSASVDSRSFWEYYSRAFEACVRSGHVFTVMSSYNSLNGIPTSANPFLLTDLLRKQWGFRGYVVSDCDAIEDIFDSHHFAASYVEAAALAINAGSSINCGDTLQKYLGSAVDQMLVGNSALDEALIRAFTGRFLLGEFDAPEQNPYHVISVECLESEAHRELARETARQSVVLFKNDNHTLPLDKQHIKKIAVIGPMADVCELGNYSGRPLSRISPLLGIRRHLGIAEGAEHYRRAADATDLSHGLQLQYGSDGGQFLTGITNGSSALFKRVLFDGATHFRARVASLTAGGSIEIYLDNLDGAPIAKLQVANTGDWEKWVDVTAAIPPITGEHQVLLKFIGGAGQLFTLRLFNLLPAPPFASQNHGAIEVAYALGCTVTGEKNATDFAAAVDAAAKADIALLFVGADEQVDAEARDRQNIGLPGVQHELVQAVHAANPQTVLVLCSNCPVAVNWEQKNLPAIVGGLLLGSQQGLALADVLFGDYNPGGKLSTTWYRDAADLPDFHDYNIRVGRTYMYFQGLPLYPFGYGLSYTSFRYGRLLMDKNSIGPGETVTVSFALTNSGSRDGDEVVQLYVAFPDTKIQRPNKQLVNFERVHLAAGEKKAVSLEIPYDHWAFQYWDEARNQFAVEPGPVTVMIGSSSADIRLQEELQYRS